MIERIKSWAVVGLLAVIVAMLLPEAIKGLFPKIFDSDDVPAQGKSSDVDFPVVVRVKGGLLEVATVRSTGNFPQTPELLSFFQGNDRRTLSKLWREKTATPLGEVRSAAPPRHIPPAPRRG